MAISTDKENLGPDRLISLPKITQLVKKMEMDRNLDNQAQKSIRLYYL